MHGALARSPFAVYGELGAVLTAPKVRLTRSVDDVTQAIDQLAGLRDRGAISAEDFEAKKAELLGRL